MTLNLLIDDSRWRNSFKTLTADVRKAVRMVMKDYDVKGAVITLKFASDDEVEALNHLYRGKKKPTNVLSFPNDESPHPSSVGGRGKRALRAGEGECELGDIIFAYETIKREAKEQKKTFRAHTLHLVVHGVLHLLGHDHIKKADAEEMEAIEIQYLKRLSIANPYEAR